MEYYRKAYPDQRLAAVLLLVALERFQGLYPRLDRALDLSIEFCLLVTVLASHLTLSSADLGQ